MIVTPSDARKIIKAHYGNDFEFRITTGVTLGIRPNYEILSGIPMLAWTRMARGADSVVKIGLCSPTGIVDWNWTNDKPIK